MCIAEGFRLGPDGMIGCFASIQFVPSIASSCRHCLYMCVWMPFDLVLFVGILLGCETLNSVWMPTLFLQGSSYLGKSCEPLSLSIAQNQANTRELLSMNYERINMCLPGIGRLWLWHWVIPLFWIQQWQFILLGLVLSSQYNKNKITLWWTNIVIENVHL